MRTRSARRAAVGAAAIAMIAAAAAQPARAQTASASLSMEEAIRLAIATNLTSKLAQASAVETRGRVLQEAAGLLPQVTGTMSQSRQFKENLASLGFTGGNPLLGNPVIGPFNVFDARLNLTWKLLDVGTIWSTKEAMARDRVALLQVDLAAEQVATAAALAYIEALRSIRAVGDAQSNFQLSESLLTQTQHQHEAGTANGVDLARAETRVAIDKQTLIQAALAAYESDVRLKRVIGAPLAAGITLAEPPAEAPVTVPEEGPSLTAAEADRFELRIEREQVAAETDAVAAAKSEFLPVITAFGDYGFSGNLPSSTARTGQIGGRLELPIFTGGETLGRIKEAKGGRQAAQSTYDDTRIQLEEDVRISLHALAAEKEDLDAAETRVTQAQRELELARRRYRSGLGDNIQVVTAQSSLSDALQARTDAWARYADARLNTAAALGRARTFHL